MIVCSFMTLISGSFSSWEGPPLRHLMQVYVIRIGIYYPPVKYDVHKKAPHGTGEFSGVKCINPKRKMKPHHIDIKFSVKGQTPRTNINSSTNN